MPKKSLPVRGAWIEITLSRLRLLFSQSLPVRGAWIEMMRSASSENVGVSSLPVRGAWIEMD